ncbi:MAG: RluA family pseudouridine synthase [Candidatus Gottesmanbacteria bacterium]
MDISIIFKDASFLAINKPVGVVVNRAESVKGETIQDWMEQTYPIFSHTEPETQEYCDFVDRSGVVHRIDKETSGILLIAKTLPAFIELQRQFKERIIKKTYLAIVHGELVPKEGEVRAPVGRLPWNRERFGIVPGGKDSITKYKVINSQLTIHSKEKISFVELYPETGRTHQIRVHMKYINHPLLGDYLYAGRKTSRDDREWAPRVMLHAWKIILFHPTTGEELAIEAPIPDDMNRIIS